jgi:hypothetical protein
MLWWALWMGCAEPEMEADPGPQPGDFTVAGPGGPARAFDEGELFSACAYLDGGEIDVDHHNHAIMVDGLLLLPWAPEYAGGGGVSFFDVSDPCAPIKVGEAASDVMRETHTIGLSLGERRYAAVDYMVAPPADGPSTQGGVGIWDITDPTAPVWVSQLDLPNHVYPDSYTRITMGVTWVGDVIYAPTSSNGVYVIDASDPLQLELVDQILFEGPHIVGAMRVWGHVGMVTSAGVSRVVMLDLSDPLHPTPIPGGDFSTEDADGDVRPHYYANVGSQWGLFTRSKDGGGPLVYDLSDPSSPTWVSELRTPLGDGGYVFQHEDKLFFGDSAYGTVYDFSDPAQPVDEGTFLLRGDLDTVTPIGNVAIVSVDEKADPGRASAVIPWRAAPDDRGPTPGMTSPAQGELQVAPTSWVGVVFDEAVEPVSAHAGSLRLLDAWGRPVPGRYYVSENIVNFVPDAPMSEGWHTLDLPAGGVTDVSGNPVEAPRQVRFHVRSAP